MLTSFHYVMIMTYCRSWLMSIRRRNSRGRKEVGIIGQASWLSSVVNLVNTSKKNTIP